MISVWAPRVDRVQLRRLTPACTTISEHDLDPADDGSGWWRTDVAMAEGERYGFLLGDSTELLSLIHI